MALVPFCLMVMPISAEWVNVDVTAYSPYECPNEQTASGTVPTAGRTIAVNWLPFGTTVIINGQTYTVEDRGGMNGIDIFMNSHDEAIQFGRQTLSVYINR